MSDAPGLQSARRGRHLIMRRRHQQNPITQKNIHTIARMEEELENARGFGERVADRFASVIGSWTFIIIQSWVLVIWMALNVVAWHYRWDPYPFILLNLALSFQAAYAAPVLMMSQNRQAWLAVRRNQLDLQINLLAEQESTETLRLLRQVCEKMGINPDDGGKLAALEQATRPDILAREIDKAIVPKSESREETNRGSESTSQRPRQQGISGLTR